MTNRNGKYALITGASSGLGYELVNLFARDGYNMVIVSRNQIRLNQIAREFSRQYNIDILPLSKDLMQREAPQEVYDEVKSKGIEVEILVNDAGMGEDNSFTETDLNKNLEIIQLNVTSVVHLTKLFLKDMVERNAGRIFHIVASAAVIPEPLMAVYAATKAFIFSLTDSLIYELKNTSVILSAFIPVAGHTGFFGRTRSENILTVKEEKNPEIVAKIGYDALMKGERRIIVGLKHKKQTDISNLSSENKISREM